MAARLDGVLEDRDSWKARHCSIAKSLDVIGTRSAMLILREAFYGTTRFDDFANRVGITEAVAAARLKELTVAGIFERQPYKIPGSRTRYEYVLTQMGRDLLPTLVSLMQWGDKYLQGSHGTPLDIVEDATGESVSTDVRTDDGRRVDLDDLRVQVHPARARTTGM